MKYSYVLWDFNGTLLDDVDVCLHIMNTLLKEKEMPALTMEKYKDVFTFPVSEYYKRVGIIKGDDEFNEVAHKWMDMYYELEPTTTLHKDIVEVLEFFKHTNIKQGVLSASRKDQLDRLLKQVNIDTYMDNILGISDIYAKSKVHIGIEFIKNSIYQKDEIVMIGDSVHDYEVASEMGIDCILVAAGHQSRKVLETCGCRVLDSASELMKLNIWKGVNV